jgi:Na+/H+-translocating membrane pyrophosphatase
VHGDLYVVALAAAVMLTMVSIVVAVDSYGHITDNVGVWSRACAGSRPRARPQAAQ